MNLIEQLRAIHPADTRPEIRNEAAQEIEDLYRQHQDDEKEIARLQTLVTDLAPFLAIWAGQYQRDHDLDGLHPVHYDMLEASGCRMDDFQRATNANT